jgi:hypothetical protein
LKTKLILAGVLALGAVGVYGWQASRDKAAEEQVKALTDKVRAEGALEVGYEKVSTGFFNNEVTISRVKVVPLKSKGKMPSELMIDRIVLGAAQLQQSKAPNQADLSIQGAVIPVEALGLSAPQKAKFVQQHGEVLRMNADMHYRYRPETKELDLTGSVGADHLGALELSLMLGNVLSPQLDADSAALQQAMISLSLRGLEIRYRDNGLADSAFQEEADKSGLDIETYKANLVRKLEQDLQKQPSEKSTAAVKAITAFIRKPKTLSIKANPDSAIPVIGLMTGLMNPAPVLQMLNLSISSNL